MGLLDLLTNDVDERSKQVDTSLEGLARDSHVMRSLLGSEAPSTSEGEGQTASSMIDRLARSSRMFYGQNIKGTPSGGRPTERFANEGGPLGAAGQAPGYDTEVNQYFPPEEAPPNWVQGVGLVNARPAAQRQLTPEEMVRVLPTAAAQTAGQLSPTELPGEAIRAIPSTGNAYVDQGVQGVGGIFPYLMPGIGQAKIATDIASTGVNVAAGNVSPVEGGIQMGALALFPAAGKVGSRLLRMATTGVIGLGANEAQERAEGQDPTWAQRTGAFVGGAAGGAFGGHRLPGVSEARSVEATQEMIRAKAAEHGVDPALMLGLAESESSFNQGAVSSSGVKGLFQFTKKTAKAYGVDRDDPVSQADGAARYLKDLLAKNEGDVAQTLRDYKGVSVGGATEGAVQHTLGTIEKYRGEQTAPDTQQQQQAPAQAATETPEQQAAKTDLDKQIAAISQPVDLGEHAAYQPGQYVTAAPIVEHEIQNGPNAGTARRGVIATDLTYEQARAIDPYAHAKDDGFFIGERHVSRPEGYEATQVQTSEELSSQDRAYNDLSNMFDKVNTVDRRASMMHGEETGRLDKQFTPFLKRLELAVYGNATIDDETMNNMRRTRVYRELTKEFGRDAVDDAISKYQLPPEDLLATSRETVDAERNRSQGEDEGRVLSERDSGDGRGPSAEASGSDRLQLRGREEEITPKEEAQIAGSEIRDDLTDEAAGHTPEDIQRTRQLGELHSEIIPGAAALIEQDILPRIKKFGEGVQDIAERTQGNLAPALASDAAELTRQSLLEPLGYERHRLTQVVTQTVKERAAFNRQKAAENVRFQMAMEEGKPMQEQWQSDAANKLRSLYNESAEMTRAAGDRTGHKLLQNLHENYNYGSFKYDPKLAEQVLGKKPTGEQTMATLRGKGSRLLRGQAGFLKEKTMTLRDHLERGEVPMHDNPFEQYFEYEKQAGRLRVAHHAIGNIVDRGVGQILNPADEPAARQAVRAGLMHPQDPSFSVRQPTEEGTLKGHDIYIPPESWQLIKNHLSSGPNNALAKLVMPFNMLHNMTTLFGVAHATITAENWVGTRGTNTLTRLAKGEILDAGKTLGDNFYGRKIRNEYLKPGSIDDASVKEDVEWIKKIGGGIERNPVNYKEFTRSFTRAMVNNNYLGALPRGAGAAIENMTGWLMHDLVPMAKLDAFRTEYRTALKNLPDGASEMERTKAVANAWSSIDDRMGEVFRDRNFMNKNVMFWADLVFPRANWTFGTYKALGKTGADTYRAGRDIVHGKRPQLTANMAFFPAYAALAVMPVNTALQKLMTGKWPWETDTPTKDMLLGARDGGMLKDGSPSRISMVNYIRDIASMAKDPSGTLAAKMTPLFSVFKYWQNNSDYRHDQVYDPTADYATQAMQVGKMMAKEMFEPFIVSNVKRLTNEGASAYATAGSMLGMSPVSVGASQSELGEVLGKYYQRKNELKAGLSPELRKQSDNEREVLAAYRRSPVEGDNLAVKLNVDWDKAKHLAKVSTSSPLQSQMHGVDLETAEKAYRVATPSQRAEIADIVKEKALQEKDHARGDAVLREFGWQRPPLTAQEAHAAQTKEAVHQSYTPSQAAAQEAQVAIAKKLGVRIPTPSQQVSQSRKSSAGIRIAAPSIHLPGIR